MHSTTCPVPSEQLPINEYQALKEAWLFNWLNLPLPQYISKIVWLWLGSWLISGPVAAASFTPKKYLVQFILISIVGSSFLVFLLVLRLYLGWQYINSRLTNPIVIYEESGWYDGQSWTKPPEVLAQDQLIATYQVLPILQRLHRTFYILGLLLVIDILGWFFC